MPALKPSIPAPLLLTALGLLLVSGLAGIFHVRLAGGHGYPAFSSLNPDPSGTALLFDALSRTHRFLSVTREFRPAAETAARQSIRQSTLLLLGYQPSLLESSSDEQLKNWETLANLGNRVIIAVDPSGMLPEARSVFFRKPAEPHKPTGESAVPGPALSRLWQIQLARAPNPSARWPLYFESAEGWTTLVDAAGLPVVVSRWFGTEAVVLCASSFPFSGKSLAEHPDDRLLSELIGTQPRVIFDEAHLGVVDTRGILSLARRYRLMGLLTGLVLLALAFVWNQATGFPPRTEPVESTVTGQDSRSGLLHLLRGQIPPARLIAACISEWQRTHPGANFSAALPNEPVAAYRVMQERISQEQISKRAAV